MNNKNKIPGMMHQIELDILRGLAALVPKNGKILEIGAFYGRTTSALYHGKDSSVNLTVVDFWQYKTHLDHPWINFEGDSELLKLVNKLSVEHGSYRAGFEYCLADILHDIEVLQIDSKKIINHEDYDFIFIDGDHEETVGFDISNSIKNSKTLVFGDDYLINAFPDIRNNVYSNKKDRCVVLPMSMYTKLWGLIPNRGYWRENISKIFDAMEGKSYE